VQGMCTES